MLAGVGRWTEYGALMVADAGIRAVIAVATFLAGWGVVGYLWATVVAHWHGCCSCSSLPRAQPLGCRRRAEQARSCVGHRIRSRRGCQRDPGHGFSGPPQTAAGDLGAEGGVVILAVTLTRAPLLVPLTAMQGNLIAYFVDHRGIG